LSTYIVVVRYSHSLTITFINQWHCRYYWGIPVALSFQQLLPTAVGAGANTVGFPK
jgi:hypothetical protein